MITEQQGKEIALAALSWLDTPHVNGAKAKGKGVDCGMLLIGCLEDAKLCDKDAICIAPYSNEWHLHHSEEWFLHYVQNYCVKVDSMQPGDFLMYQYGRCVSHAGIYVGRNYVVHAQLDRGVIMSELDDVIFFDNKGNSRLRGIYRFCGGDK